MQSVTKTRLSYDTIYALAENAFPGCAITEVRELTEGMFNSAYYIAGSGILTNGVILKIGPQQGTKLLTYEKDILKTEVAVYRMLEKKDVPVPKVLYADYSGSFLPCAYFFMTYIPGDLWKNADEKRLQRCREKLMEELGRIHAEIHSVAGAHFGYIKEDSRYQFDSWSEAFAGMMRDICNDGICDGLILPYNEIMSIVRSYRECLDEIASPRLVDFDLWAGNVILGEDGDEYTINGIIDFERCFFGDPYADFISAVMIFDDVSKETDFIRGYGEPVVLDENARIRMDLYRLYLSLIMYVETYRYDEEYAQKTKLWLRDQISKLMEALSEKRW